MDIAEREAVLQSMDLPQRSSPATGAAATEDAAAEDAFATDGLACLPNSPSMRLLSMDSGYAGTSGEASRPTSTIGAAGKTGQGPGCGALPKGLEVRRGGQTELV